MSDKPMYYARVKESILHESDKPIEVESFTVVELFAKIDQLKQENEKLKGELDISCQALHEYRDNMSHECEQENKDSRVVAFGKIYTGRRALNALNKMPIACKMRNDRYELETSSTGNSDQKICAELDPKCGA